MKTKGNASLCMQIVLGVKSQNNSVTRSGFYEPAIGHVEASVHCQGESRIKVELEIKETEDSIDISGSDVILNTWIMFGDVLKTINLVKGNLEYIDLPIELEFEKQTLKCCGFIEGVYQKGVLTLEYLHCEVERREG